MLRFLLDESGRIGLCGKWDERKRTEMVNEVQRKCKGGILNYRTNPFLLFKILLLIFTALRMTSQNCMYVFVRVHVHTLGLGAHFGLATPPAVHLPAARTLSPGVKMAWKRNKRFKSACLLPTLNRRRSPRRRLMKSWMKVGGRHPENPARENMSTE